MILNRRILHPLNKKNILFIKIKNSEKKSQRMLRRKDIRMELEKKEWN